MPNVADLELGKPDLVGERILAFFARKPPHYAVYGVRRRVAIHFADDAAEADTQRKAVSELAPLRGEIDGLIDGWRSGSAHSFFGLENAEQLKSKADRYERRVGDALVVALEGQLPLAKETLIAIKRDIVNERTAWARFEYLIGAFAMALLVMLVAFLAAATYPFGSLHATEVRRWWVAGIAIGFGLVFGVSLFLAGREQARVKARVATAAAGAQDEMRGGNVEDEEDGGAKPKSRWIAAVPAMLLFLLLAIPVLAVLLKPSFSYDEHLAFGGLSPAIDLWRAAAAGAVGAFFSIAIGIRTRTVLPDLLRTSNLMDAVLRVTIGFIAGAVLMALIKAGLVSVQIGTTAVKDSGALTVVLFGFFAGFSERLVPDLLAKASASTGGSTDGAAGGPGARGNPAAGPTPPPPPPPPPPPGGSPPGPQPGTGPETQDPAPEQAAEDGCAADVELGDDEATSDDELPPAAGGVEKPTEGGTTT